jgi:hypothetical protein
LTEAEEWETDKLCNIFEEKKRVVIRAEYAGCGKSYACEHMQQRGHNVLFVCPTNVLAKKYDNDISTGITINKFFSIGMTEDSKLKRFDDSLYDTIVFDEIYFHDVRKLARIKHYFEKHPEKIIIATGDTNQLETIAMMSNTKGYDEYSDHCIDTIFPNRMFLKENKRLKNEDDKQKLKQLKTDIFNNDISVKNIIDKYFKTTTRHDTLSNLAYRNSTCKTVANNVRQLLNKKLEYEVDEVLICRKWFKMGTTTFNVNYEYTVIATDESTATLDNGIKLNVVLLRSNFIHNYCRTCHSMQGSTIKDKITIYDWQHFFVSRKWLYTAFTRAEYLDNVMFFDYKEQAENRRALDRYLERKIERYKQQDLKAGRHIDEKDYITPEWLFNCFGKSCNCCGDCLVYEVEGGVVKSNITAQRIDNEVGHEMGNCVASCDYCNCAMSNKEE